MATQLDAREMHEIVRRQATNVLHRCAVKPGSVLLASLGAMLSLSSGNALAVTLTIGDGVVVKYGDDASMVVRDGLHTGYNVNFTSINDDNLGGQSNQSAGTPNPGDWRGLQILPTATPAVIAIGGLTLQFAGSSNAAALEIAHLPYAFDGLSISDSVLGIRALDATTVQFTNLSLFGNQVGMEARQYAAPTITHSEIEFNSQLGVLNLTPQTPVPALNNWWGYATGPKDPIANPSGQGNAVSAGVNYGQFLTTVPLLACSIKVADGKYTVGQQTVPLALYCRNAVTFALSESTDFSSARFSQLDSNPMFVNYTFVGGARAFDLYAQFKSSGGNPTTVTVALPQSITYIPPPPPPTVTIDAPASGSELSANTQVAATVTSSISIASVDIFADATKIATVASPPYQAIWSIAGVSLANHTLKVIATDALGQTGQAAEVVTVVSADQAGPAVQNISFQDAPLANGATLTAGGILAAQVSDPSGVASVIAAIDGTTITGGSLTGTQYTLPLTFNQFANGAHALVLTAKDTIPNTTQVTIAFTLAIPAPSEPVITAPANGAQISQPTVSVSGTAGVGTQVQLYLDGSAVGSLLSTSGPGTFSHSVALPTQGTHQISADARNGRDTSAPSNSVSVTYTPPPPSIVITSPAKNATLTSDTDISVAIIDTAGITQVEFGIDGSAVATLTASPYTWHWSIASAAQGSHTVAVKATDGIGNILQASVPVTVQFTPPPPPPIVTPYTGAVSSISPATSYGEQPITIAGQAIDRTLSSPVPNALLTLALQVNGFKRQISLTTDSNGAFSYPFTPYSTDAGTYVVSVIHPQETTLPPLGQFTINRLGVSPSTYRLQAARTVPTTVPVVVSASSGSGVSGVYVSADPAAQPSGSLPAGITITPPVAINLTAGKSVTINVPFIADNSGGNSGTVILVAHTSDSGTASRGTVAVNYSLSQPTPALYPQPTFIQSGVTQGKQVSATVMVQNKGLIAATNVVAQLRNSDGSINPPAWVFLASGTSAATLDVGASQTIQLNAAPTSAVSDGIYTFNIYISAGNATGGNIPVSIAVTQSGVGNVLFNAADIYTSTLDSQGQTIQGLAGTTIKVQNQNVYTVVGSATTDIAGNAQIDNLPVGKYTFVASAPNHSSASGVLAVQPGATTAQSVFLDYNVISIQWSVTETDIPDEYHVTLNATYQTQVPAPVVVIEPTSINLPNLQIGETFTGEMTITNYGLVRADDVVFTPPSSDGYFQFAFMGEVPTSLQAHQRISLPYKITATSLLPAGAAASVMRAGQKAISVASSTRAMLSIGGARASANATAGGTCNTYSKPAELTFDFSCANGTEMKSSASAVFARVYGQCTSSSGGGGGGGSGGNDANGFGGPLYGCPVGQPLGSSPGCTPDCVSCLSHGGGTSGGGGVGGSGPSGPGVGGGPPPPVVLGSHP